MEQPNSSPSSVRVLVRPPAASTPAASAATSNPPIPPPQNPSSSSSVTASAAAAASPLDGVVVVGFLGSRAATDVSHFINRLLDANVFGSGGLDKDLFPSPSDGVGQEEEWFQRRRISYYHDAEKGMVFLQFSSSLSPLSLLASSQTDGRGDGSASVLELSDAEDLRGMLFMFSVCHVIIFIHEGLRLDTPILKKFRMLQAAKHALAPFLRSQIAPTLTKSPSSVSLSMAQRASSASPPGRRGGTSNRHGSAISLMSGTGSHPLLLPGHCTPVILFVFSDDMLDGPNPASNVEDSADASSLNQPPSMGGLPRPSLNLKGTGSVVMLARPASKIEGSYRKKLQSSLEAQVRFLIKKCRMLVGTESGHLGSRGVGHVSSFPLFSLDASRVVALLDRSENQRGESLDFITGLLEEALNSKTVLDMFSLENHCQPLNNEDIQLIKDFIFRQSDTLRGRGGLPSNANTGAAAGVGMVAAAAAAAAASAAAGKPVRVPELPSLENWLSLSNVILDSLLSAKDGSMNEIGNMKKIPRQRSANEIRDEQISAPGTNPIEAAISCLESSKGLNMKFSISWCQRALPAAKEVYLKELPACYPTTLHKTQLERALQAFHSMVKGPAVQLFSKKLEDQCTSIWESGRQLCDAVSLTGKPCMHQRHDDKKQHSSGYVFLHACACGRSRRLRDDPFDFDSANITFNCFANCENLLPTLVLPRGGNAGFLPPSSWRLMRLGGARYYKPSKGLLQTGFCLTEKYLFKWTISLEREKETSSFPVGVTGRSSVVSTTPDLKHVSIVDEEVKKSGAAEFPREVKHGGSENQKKHLEMLHSDDSSISFGKGLPSFNMKKPFSEVVAGTIATDSTFPSLQQSKQPKTNAEKSMRLVTSADKTDDQIHEADSRQGPQRGDHISVQESTHRQGPNLQNASNPFLQIGSNIVPVNLGGEKIKSNNSLKQVIVYVGFEHECSYGHRFLLSPEHLKELDPAYSLPDKLHLSTDDSDGNLENKNSVHDKILQKSSGTMSAAVNNRKKSNRSTELVVRYSQQIDRFMLSSRSDLEKLPSVHGLSMYSDSMGKLEGNPPHLRLDDGGTAFTLLNRKLPIYMNCPHCKNSTRQDHQKIKFASTVSQLQRIFLVTPPFPTVLATHPVIQFEVSMMHKRLSYY
ncbi:uncharacterized protein [Elaeis guineensis]|uniref:uncharacterized protein isoform X2 n=1 Tax=Elaeis guineensis var. tenera TaxID=51953 RepID=UPI003C6D3E9A